jgi:hypothetical protein
VPLVTHRPVQQSLSPLTLATIGAAVLIVVALGFKIIPGLLNLKGTAAGEFEDSTGLVKVSFPDSWYHLNLHDGPGTPHSGSDRLEDTLRGSFYLQRGNIPEAVLYFRIVSLGLNTGPVEFVKEKDRARATYEWYQQNIERLGGTYSPTIERLGDRSLPYTKVKVGTHDAYRVEGEVMMGSWRLYCWEQGGSFRTSITWFQWGSKVYMIYVVIPEELYLVTWPEVQQVLSRVELRNVTI